jgi:phosphoribosylformimino-5-aminoimidazole carboxamide ribotide isomerase
VTDRILYPVMDLLGGRLVRALRDDDGALNLADDDPLAVALRWREQGAEWLHLVDLEGARDGAPRQLETIRTIIEAAELPTQVAGGLRDIASVEAALEAGARRVVLSAATPDDQALITACVPRWGERIAVALEARDGWMTVAGWLPSDAAPALDVARAMRYLGVETLLFTSVITTGESDPLPGALRSALSDVRLIAGGAVSSLDDLRRLLALGMDGVLLGRALHAELFTLEEALRVAREVALTVPHAFAASETQENSAAAIETPETPAPTDPDEALGMAETQKMASVGKPPALDQPTEEPRGGEDAALGEAASEE